MADETDLFYLTVKIIPSPSLWIPCKEIRGHCGSYNG